MAPFAIRIRPPTGLLLPKHVQLLAGISEGAKGQVELTRAGGLLTAGTAPGASGPDIAENLAGSGLPALTRAFQSPRVLCSPLTGRVGGLLDARDLARELEKEFSRVTEPSGAGFVGIDDGTGDITALGLKLVFAAMDPGTFGVWVDGVDTGTRLPHGDADAMDLAEWLALIAGHQLAEATLAPIAPHQIPIGWLEHHGDGLVTLGAAVRGGVLDARKLQFLAAMERPVVLTPWRTMLLCDLDEWAAEQVVRVLAPLGFVFDAESHVVTDLANGAWTDLG